MTTIVRDNYVEFYYPSIVSQRRQHHAFAKSRSLLIPDLASAASSSSHTSTREEDNNDSEQSRRGVHVTVDTVVTAWSTYLHHQNSHEGNSVNNNSSSSSSNDVGEMTIRTKSMATTTTTTAASSSSSVSLLASAASKKATSSSINIIDTTLSSSIGHRIAGSHSNSDKDNNCIGSSSIDIIHMDTPARKSLPPFLQLRSVPNKGLGVFSTVNLPAGTYLGEYTGEILLNDKIKDRRYLQQDLRTLDDDAWCASRLDRGQTMTGCYLYGISLPPTSSSTSLEKKRIYIDAEDEYSSTWTRFINHAFPPHANVCPRSIHESYTGQPRVWFVTNRHVHRGDELCFDYGDDYWLDDDTVV